MRLSLSIKINNNFFLTKNQAARRRFVKRLYIPLPNHKAREELIKTVVKTENDKGNKCIMSDEVIN